MARSLGEGLDRAASQGMKYSFAVLLEPDDVIGALELLGCRPTSSTELPPGWRSPFLTR